MIGWRERVVLPFLSDLPITAKVDTGAMTSSLHASDLTVVESDTGPVARFEFHPDPVHASAWVAMPAGRSPYADPGPTSVVAPIVDFRLVRSSNGAEETRPVIRTEVEIGTDRFEIDVTLTCRKRMGFRMLLGRRVLEDRYWVDPGRDFLRTGP